MLLLRAAIPTSGFAPNNAPRPAPGAAETPGGLVIATIYYFEAPVSIEFVDFFERELQPELIAAGMPILAYFVSETGPNNFPRLPVREADHAFVWFSASADPADYERQLDALATSSAWNDVDEQLRRKLSAPQEVLRLRPTARSRLHS